MIEACVKCYHIQEGNTKKEIIKEIKAFLEDPDNFYVKYNPITGYYKFEMIK